MTAFTYTMPSDAGVTCRDPTSQFFAVPITHGNGLYDGTTSTTARVVVGVYDQQASPCGVWHYSKTQSDMVYPCVALYTDANENNTPRRARRARSLRKL